MVRTKSGAKKIEPDDNRTMFRQLNDKILELRRLHIAASQQHQNEMDHIKNQIDDLCAMCDQLTQQTATKTKTNEQPSISIASSSKQVIQNSSEFNTISQFTTKKMKARKSMKITEHSATSTRVLRNRSKISKKTMASIDAMRFHQELAASKRTLREITCFESTSRSSMSTYSTSTSKNMLEFFDCKPCTIPLRDCKRRTRQH